MDQAAMTRPTWLEVDLGAICANASAIMAHAGAREMIAVLKADGYGHGAVPVARHLHHATGVGRFAVATVDEGVALRTGLADLDGGRSEILLLGAQDVSMVPVLVAHDLSAVVDGPAWLDAAEGLLREGDTLGVHLELDTGMGRVGVSDCDALAGLYERVQANPRLVLRGVATHFATADVAVADAVFTRQARAFVECLERLRIPRHLWHCANSPACVWHAGEVPTEVIRVGNALFGYDLSDLTDVPDGLRLAPTFELKTRVASVRCVRAGDSVSYGATWTAAANRWVGTLPIGYADGFRRAFQGMNVLVNGEFQEIVGRISMDQTLVTLPGPVPVGTPVTLIGRQGRRAVSLAEVAARAGVIGAEIVLGLIPRVYRTYRGGSTAADPPECV